MSRHEWACQQEVDRLSSQRTYQMYLLDKTQFDLLNTGGHILGINGYCLDAPDQIPAGSMRSSAWGSALVCQERGLTCSELTIRKNLAAALVAEVLGETK